MQATKSRSSLQEFSPTQLSLVVECASLIPSLLPFTSSAFLGTGGGAFAGTGGGGAVAVTGGGGEVAGTGGGGAVAGTGGGVLVVFLLVPF
jgi:hypothetical protein